MTVIAHEFRTPLTAILSSIELLDRYSDRMPEAKKAQRYQTIRNLVWYLNDTVQEISLVMQDTVDETLPLKLGTFDLLPFVRQIIDDMQVIKDTEQLITLDIETCDKAQQVTWDEKLVRRIVMNLVGNALKYSDEEITCRIECTAQQITFAVEDRGIGIHSEDQPHIFEAFYRSQNAEFVSGTGVGLYVVDRAVQAHGGTIDFETKPGKGSIFLVVLPRHSEAVRHT